MNLGKGLWMLCPVKLDLYTPRSLPSPIVSLHKIKTQQRIVRRGKRKKKKEALNEDTVKLTQLKRNARVLEAVVYFLQRLLSLAFNFNLPHTFALYVMRLCS